MEAVFYVPTTQQGTITAKVLDVTNTMTVYGISGLYSTVQAM